MNSKDMFTGYDNDLYDTNKYNDSNKYNNYDNIIICAHPRDETIFFNSFITSNSLVMFLSNAVDQKTNVFTQDVMIKKRAAYVFLNEVEDFNVTYQIPEKIRLIIKDYLSYSNYDRIITHTRISEKIDVQNRRIYEFIRSLNLSNHYIC